MNIPTKSKHEFFMRTAYLSAELSKDPRTKVGAVLVKDNNIISTGYNNFPRGVADLEEHYLDREIKYSKVVHAELNAILNAARSGVSTLRSTLYTQGVPCSECAKAVIQSGCNLLVVHKQWPNLIHTEKWRKSVELSFQMLSEAGVNVEELDTPLGVAGYLDGKIITV